MKKYTKRHYRLTAWQIAMLEQLVRDELSRHADDPSRMAADLHLLSMTLEKAVQITVTKPSTTG